MLLVNVNTKQFIPSAGSNFIQPVESRDQVIYGTRVEVRFQLYNPDGTAFVLNESDTFCCAGDINFIHTDDLMFYSGHEMCRIIDAEQGVVGVTIDATSDSFADKATSQNTRMYVQLKRHVAGDTLGDTVLQDIVYAQPAVMTTEGAPASSDPEYMTAAATLALLRTAPDYQFSADGETGWHDEQDIATDRFYRERRNGGEWGPAIELIEGKTGQTGAAAGFATPSVTVETLPAGSDATASVTASGDDTAKAFNFNFGIPKGADGKNGTDGKAGADGADGVSSYTYVAYASDASGADFSLTPTDALKYRAEIHTTTAIETPDAEDFAGATWVKYIGDDGAGAGDMLKSVYDTNDDGIVDHAAAADAVGATSAAQVADTVGKAHTHANKTTLDKLAETDGKLTFDGSEIGGASNWNDITGKPETFPPSAHNHAITDVTGLEDALQNAGSVKSVNGQLPDESGNVTIETGGAVDESRLLPENAGADELAIKRIGASGIDGNTHLMLHFDEESGIPADSSQVEILVTANDTAADAATAKFGKARNLNNSYLSLTCPAMATGTGDFTYEGWFYFNELNKCRGLFGVDMGLYVALWGDNTFGVAISTSGSSWNYNHMDSNRSEATATQGVWQHIALVRNKGNVTLYLNGNSILSFDIGADTVITGNMGNNPFRIGYPLGGMSSVADFCDEFRFSTVARWTGNFTPPEKAYTASTESWDPISMEELRDELSAVGAVAVSNPANGDIPCFDADVVVGSNDETVKFLLQPATTDGELIDSAAGAVTSATITNHSLTVSESGEIEFSSSKYATVPASGILADVLRHDKTWVFDLLVYLDQTSSQSRFFGTESGGDFFCQWTGDYGFDFKYGDTWISTLTGNVGEWNLLTLEYYQKNGTWHVALYLQGVLCQDKEISTSFDPKTSELAIGRSTSGSYLCSGKIRAIRIREGALYNGQSFTPDEFPYQEPQTVGEWGKLNKSLLAMKSDVLPEWHQLSGSSTITLDRADGELQKVTLTQNCTLTAPTLSAANPTLLLQVTSSSAVTVTVGETNIVTDHTGTFQVGWFYDGEATRRYPAVEVA